MSERDRILWHCRRGLLELDLILQRFMAQQFDRLTPAELDAFKFLLDYEDNDLLDLVMRRAEPVDHRVAAVLDMLRTA